MGYVADLCRAQIDKGSLQSTLNQILSMQQIMATSLTSTVTDQTAVYILPKREMTKRYARQSRP